MVNSEDILQLLDSKEIRVPKSQLKEDVPLVHQGIDSLEIATLLFRVEDKFNVSIPTDVVGQLHSLCDIKKFLNSKGA